MNVNGDQVVEVLFAEHYEMSQALGLDRLNPALHLGAHVRSLNRAGANIEAFDTERVFERPPEFWCRDRGTRSRPGGE